MKSRLTVVLVSTFFSAFLCSVTARAQDVEANSRDLELLTHDVLAQKIDRLNMAPFALNEGQLNLQLTDLAARVAVLTQVQLDLPGFGGGGDHDYQAGTGDLDARRYDNAIRHFDAVIEKKTTRAEGAYYWKAYAQERSGRRAAALATLTELRRVYPQTRWLVQAQALQAEIHAGEGRGANAASENDEELKLIALNGLMESDAERAMPILQALLAGAEPPGVKDRALFVLSQSSSPAASRLLLDIARGKADPDLQLKAIRYIGMMGDGALHGELVKIYGASSDVNLKREIIHSYLLSGSKHALLDAARGERNEELRREAVRTLAQTGGKEELWALYKSESGPELRLDIVHAMLLDADSSHLLEIAKTEKDVGVRKAAIQTLALTGPGGKDAEVLLGLYRNESDAAIKRELIRGMFLQQNARALVEVARQEKSPELKRDIVQQLSLIHSKEATDYLMEILK